MISYPSFSRPSCIIILHSESCEDLCRAIPHFYWYVHLKGSHRLAKYLMCGLVKLHYLRSFVKLLLAYLKWIKFFNHITT